ncbi:hypothetical protein F3157_04020 [Virgibacillus dakarensis]|uniref:HMA domain-containing protein n=1 Tax=Lentibacillus populi TaxID=1827502 RepID=A0A9W5TUJ7_9BACI|nr:MULTISPECIES: hypothetical protein [Bacillaceae]MBT2214950.1 hypothetical protein [Virgibacillus dakarensis]MTW84824.1 hypothetical protein [Virgibacillus dakarensis]GGB31566.1 hypothetical protein GCM10011409_06160 [Lentibacillus populi]
MAEVTIIVKEATSGSAIQEIEHYLNQLDGIDRVLVDTADGEVKVEYDDKKISGKRIVDSLQQHDFLLM